MTVVTRLEKFVVFIAVLACLSLGACKSPAPGSEGGPGGASQASRNPFGGNPDTPTQRNNAALGGELHLVDLVFDVVRIDFPLGGIRHARKVWNHVDELRVGAEVIPQLARNGLRVGAAGPDAWSAIRAVVEVAGAELRRDQLVTRRGAALVIQLAPVQERESIFCYRKDNRLTGKTFATGHKLLSVDYAFHPELGGCTDLDLGFEVRHDRGAMTWERRGGIIEQVPDVDRHVFSEVDALLTLKPDEFLVLGLSEQSDNDYLLGNRFLTVERLGKLHETVMCITPRPVQTRTKVN